MLLWEKKSIHLFIIIGAEFIPATVLSWRLEGEEVVAPVLKELTSQQASMGLELGSCSEGERCSM